MQRNGGGVGQGEGEGSVNYKRLRAVDLMELMAAITTFNESRTAPLMEPPVYCPQDRKPSGVHKVAR